MTKHLISLALFALSLAAQADTWVNGYVKRDGTYVSGHYRQDSNTTNHDNYSTQQNTNPYTGTDGTRAHDYSSAAQNYGGGHIIYTVPRGGNDTATGANKQGN
jgi:hypothetical protein